MRALGPRHGDRGEPSHQLQSWSQMHIFVLLQSVFEPRLVQQCLSVVLHGLAFESVLEAD